MARLPRIAGVILGAIVAAVVLVPSASALGVTYSISSGTAGSGGWYLTDVTAQFLVSADATDTTCPAVKTFHSSSEALDCTATDGTSTVTFHLQFKIDKDKPTVTGASPDRSPNGNGWYNGAVTVTFAGTDPTSGIASCTQTVYSGPDSGGAVATGTCTDAAGNVSTGSTFGFKFDSTPPSVTGNPARPPDTNGWYTHSVAGAFTGNDSTSGIDSCTSPSYAGPDTGNVSLSGTCTDKAGNSSGASFQLQYDATPPTLSAALARSPDANGWYNHAVAVNATGSDTSSGLDSCGGQSYSGPDTDNASLTATCIDKAGNRASQTFPLKYDDTPPKLTVLPVTLGNGTATLRWTASPDSASITVLRTPGPSGRGTATVYKGNGLGFTDAKLKNGVRYLYKLSETDRAGNNTTVNAVAVPRALWAPAPGAKLKQPPLLQWTAVRGADYYNVQIFFAGRKVLSTWPVRTALRLPRTWTFSGHKNTLAKGRYRWYVWPGFGSRKAAKYGKLLGGSSLVIT